MAKNDRKVDAYIAQSQDFAIPILEHLRATVHEACPETEEAIKWQFPTFNYKGSILCSMASFKTHCAFGFWLHSKLEDPDNILQKQERTAMGSLGRIESLSDLPSKRILIKYIRKAMKLVDQGEKLSPAKKKKGAVEVVVPSWFASALKKHKKADVNFGLMSNSKRRDYVEWLEGARTEATREKRMNTALEWIAEGKSLNWKYERKS